MSINGNKLQLRLSDIYGQVNQNRPWIYMHGYLNRNAGYIFREENGEADSDVMQRFIRPIAWLYAIATKMDIDLDDAILLRFPTVCPYCVVAPCDCCKTNKNPSPKSKVYGKASYQIRKELETKYRVFKNRGKNNDLDEVASVLESIYKSNAAVWKRNKDFFPAKLLGELSELHEAISHFQSKRKSKTAVMEEIADVAAWILGFWVIIFPDKSIHREITNYYAHGCPVCCASSCVCSDGHDRANGLIDLETLTRIKAELNEVSGILPGTEVAQVDELRYSLEAAMTSGSELDARRAIKGVGRFMERIQLAFTPAEHPPEVDSRAYEKINAFMRVLSPFLQH